MDVIRKRHMDVPERPQVNKPVYQTLVFNRYEVYL